jgi:hypothetical protein
MITTVETHGSVDLDKNHLECLLEMQILGSCCRSSILIPLLEHLYFAHSGNSYIKNLKNHCPQEVAFASFLNL